MTVSSAQVRRFHKKPFVTEAVRFVHLDDGGTNADMIVDWINQTTMYVRAYKVFRSSAEVVVVIPNRLDRHQQAVVGDWIVRGVNDEFRPEKPDLFAALYEEV